MCLNMFLRVFADTLAIFGLLGCCPILLPYSYSLPLAAMLLGVCAFFSCFLDLRNKKVPSRVCAILPLLTLLLARSLWEMLILAVPILYTCIVILLNRLYPEYYSYRTFFKRSLGILLGVWFAISLTVYLEDPSKTAEQVIDTGHIIRYIILYFICGVVLQRQLRMGTERRSRGDTGQITAMLGSVGAVSLSFVISEPFLREGSFAVLRNLLILIFIPFQYVLEVLSFLVDKLKKMYSSEQYIKERGEGNPDPLTSLNHHLQNVEKREDREVTVYEPEHSPWVMLIAIVAVIIVVLLMVFAFRQLRKRRKNPLTVTRSGEAEKEKSLSRTSNRGKVRQLYREYLHREGKRGVKITKQHTTEDILRRLSDGTDPDAAAELRNIYIRARYDEANDISRSEVNTAKDAMRRIRKS